MTVAMARSLRRRSVSAERVLWDAIRNRKLAGLKFRRQVPIGRYVVDFACHEVRLVIELDGPCHDDRTNLDRERSRVIEAAGWLVMRFSGRAAFETRDAVLTEIARHAEVARGGRS